MSVRTAGREDSLLHLVRDNAEASLCGIPRSGLGPAGHADDVVCPGCIEWLPKRMAVTREQPKVRRADQ